MRFLFDSSGNYRSLEDRRKSSLENKWKASIEAATAEPGYSGLAVRSGRPLAEMVL
jgi:hypothetical protein